MPSHGGKGGARSHGGSYGHGNPGFSAGFKPNLWTCCGPKSAPGCGWRSNPASSYKCSRCDLNWDWSKRNRQQHQQSAGPGWSAAGHSRPVGKGKGQGGGWSKNWPKLSRPAGGERKRGGWGKAKDVFALNPFGPLAELADQTLVSRVEEAPGEAPKLELAEVRKQRQVLQQLLKSMPLLGEILRPAIEQMDLKEAELQGHVQQAVPPRRRVARNIKAIGRLEGRLAYLEKQHQYHNKKAEEFHDQLDAHSGKLEKLKAEGKELAATMAEGSGSSSEEEEIDRLEVDQEGTGAWQVDPSDNEYQSAAEDFNGKGGGKGRRAVRGAGRHRFETSPYGKPQGEHRAQWKGVNTPPEEQVPFLLAKAMQSINPHACGESQMLAGIITMWLDKQARPDKRRQEGPGLAAAPAAPSGSQVPGAEGTAPKGEEPPSQKPRLEEPKA